MNQKAANALPGEMESFAGDFHRLLDRIGSLEEVLECDGFGDSVPIKDRAGLVKFLEVYSAKILIPLELPVICEAFSHTNRYECKELLELDRRLCSEPRLQRFAAASQHVGQQHLYRLRPLKEQRFVQRYLAALDAGQASAWHTVVYGMSLAVYSVPLRQGLIAYSQLTLGSFIQSAAGQLHFSQAECDQLLKDVSAGIPKAVDTLLHNGQFAFFKAA